MDRFRVSDGGDSSTCDLPPKIAGPSCELGLMHVAVGDHLVEPVDVLQEFVDFFSVRTETRWSFHEAVSANRQRARRFAEFRGIDHGFSPRFSMG